VAFSPFDFSHSKTRGSRRTLTGAFGLKSRKRFIEDLNVQQRDPRGTAFEGELMQQTGALSLNPIVHSEHEPIYAVVGTLLKSSQPLNKGEPTFLY
jgi:hypothetical protein